MNKISSFLFCFIFTIGICLGQNSRLEKDYLEDQLYFGLTYNSLINTPNGFDQKGFSYGITAGFIKDIPFNKQRNIGIGLGFGYSYDSYSQNLLVKHENNTDVLSISNSYETNLLSISSLDIPLEFRWRTSSLEKYKFWRIYSGIKFSYLFKHKSKYVYNEFDNIDENIDFINKFQYGAYTSMGFNTWNFYVYYSLTSILKEGTKTVDSLPVEIVPIKLGLIFYIL
jgi:hypothetical protein